MFWLWLARRVRFLVWVCAVSAAVFLGVYFGLVKAGEVIGDRLAAAFTPITSVGQGASQLVQAVPDRLAELGDHARQLVPGAGQ